MITIIQLRYILAVYETKHFGRAAQKCNVSQPSLSIQIQKAEEVLGFVIFDRSKKPIKLTQEGEELIRKARYILNTIKEIEFIKFKNEIKGEFHLGVIPTVGPYLLPLFLKSFTEKYPEVNLNIYEKTTDELVKDLLSDELDAAILSTPLKENLLIEKALYSEVFYLHVPTGHELMAYKNKKIKVDQIRKRKDLWLLTEGHCLRNQVLNLCKFKEAGNESASLNFEISSLETIKNLIRNGQGISLIPELAAGDIEKNRIVFQDPRPAREIGLVYSRSFLKEKIIEALEKEILTSLPESVTNLRSKVLKLSITGERV